MYYAFSYIQDTALSALRRNFFSAVDPELRTVEHTLTYVEAAMRGLVVLHLCDLCGFRCFACGFAV